MDVGRAYARYSETDQLIGFKFMFAVRTNSKLKIVFNLFKLINPGKLVSSLPFLPRRLVRVSPGPINSPVNTGERDAYGKDMGRNLHICLD